MTSGEAAPGEGVEDAERQLHFLRKTKLDAEQAARLAVIASALTRLQERAEQAERERDSARSHGTASIEGMSRRIASEVARAEAAEAKVTALEALLREVDGFDGFDGDVTPDWEARRLAALDRQEP